jgi:hypothetical protein
MMMMIETPEPGKAIICPWHGPQLGIVCPVCIEDKPTIERLAEVIVVSAFRAHPRCPDAAEACALQLTDALLDALSEPLAKLAPTGPTGGRP